MAVDLVRFYILWFIILTMLTSLGCLVFMEVPEYFYFIMDKVSGYNMVCNGFIHEPIKILFTSHKVQKVGAGHTM